MAINSDNCSNFVGGKAKLAGMETVTNCRLPVSEGVLGTVYTEPVSFVTASLSTRLSLSFTRRRSKPVLKPDRFENALKSGAFSKRYGFTSRVNGETDSI